MNMKQPQHKTPTQASTTGMATKRMAECPPDSNAAMDFPDSIGREAISVSVTKRSGIDALPAKATVPALSTLETFDVLEKLEAFTLLLTERHRTLALKADP